MSKNTLEQRENSDLKEWEKPSFVYDKVIEIGTKNYLVITFFGMNGSKLENTHPFSLDFQMARIECPVRSE